MKRFSLLVLLMGSILVLTSCGDEVRINILGPQVPNEPQDTTTTPPDTTSAPGDTTVTVGSRSVTVSPAGGTFTVGSVVQFKTVCREGGQTIACAGVWVSANPTVATVEEFTGVMRAKNVGQAQICRRWDYYIKDPYVCLNVTVK